MSNDRTRPFANLDYPALLERAAEEWQAVAVPFDHPHPALRELRQRIESMAEGFRDTSLSAAEQDACDELLSDIVGGTLSKLAASRTPEAYLFTILKNRIRDAARSETSRGAAYGRFAVSQPQADSLDDPEPSDDRAEERALLQSVLPRLSARLRSVVELRIDGLAYDEIAQRLGITEDTAMVRMHRAKKRLRELLRIAQPM